MVTKAAGLVIFRIFENSIQYLLLQTSYGEHHWSPPKGHVDPGESDWETALRETEEEAGIKAEDLEIFKHIQHTLNYVVKRKPKAVVYWLARLKNPLQEIKLSREHINLSWLPLRESQELQGYKDLTAVLEEFHVHAEKIAAAQP